MKSLYLSPYSLTSNSDKIQDNTLAVASCTKILCLEDPNNLYKEVMYDLSPLDFIFLIMYYPFFLSSIY